MRRGYIKLWRKTLDSGLLQNGPAWQLFGYLLLKAVYHPQRQLVNSTVYDLEPGQMIFSRAKAAADLKLGEQQIRTALSLLKKLEVITSEATNQGTLITIINWPLYQGEQPASNQPDDIRPTGEQTNGQPAPNQRITSDIPATDQNKESKKVKNININTASGGADAARAPESGPGGLSRATPEDGRAGDAADAVPGGQDGTTGDAALARGRTAEKKPCDSYATRRGRKLSGKRLASFLKFWAAFDYPKGKAEAADAWLDIPELTDALVARICAAARQEAEGRDALTAKGHTPKMAQGWISGRRWEDADPVPPGLAGRAEGGEPRPLRALYDDGRPVERPPTPEEMAANEERMKAIRKKLAERGLIGAELPARTVRAG